MTYDIEDLKNRALVESNILKQFILSASAMQRGEFKPKLDDILIHEYQMANSVTLNTILSNYLVDIAYAVNCLENPQVDYGNDSYFKLVRDLNESQYSSLDDHVKLVLDVVGGNGSFKSRDLVLKVDELWEGDKGITEFFNLDSILYCRKSIFGDDGELVRDEVKLVEGYDPEAD